MASRRTDCTAEVAEIAGIAPSAVQLSWLFVFLVLVQLVDLVLDALAQVAEAFLHLALDLVELAFRLPVAVVGGDAADLLDLAGHLVELALEVLLVHGCLLRSYAEARTRRMQAARARLRGRSSPGQASAGLLLREQQVAVGAEDRARIGLQPAVGLAAAHQSA